MKDKTAQKIMGAALRLFSERGYAGATTLAIADEAGYSEKTVFRKFKTKENLFNRTIIATAQEMEGHFDEAVFIDREYDNPREFLETFIHNTIKWVDDYFELFYITINERTRIHEPIMTGINLKMCKYIEENIPNQNIDYMTFGLTISAFIYMILVEKNRGHTTIVGPEANYFDTMVENFIDITLRVIE